MSCSSSSSKCSFAAEYVSKLESAAFLYSKMRTATLNAGRSGKIDHHVVLEDLAMIDKKMAEISIKICLLRPCFKKV